MKSLLKGMFGRIIGGVIFLAVALSSPQSVQAQGTVTFLSNLGQASAGSMTVGSDSWLAVQFGTGNNPGGYLINSVQLAMADASGNPSGITVMLYGEGGNAGGIFPGSSLGALRGTADPKAAGTYTYNSVSSLTLSPGTPYFIVVTSGTTVAKGSMDGAIRVQCRIIRVPVGAVKEEF